jgi:hypothetical protein
MCEKSITPMKTVAGWLCPKLIQRMWTRNFFHNSTVIIYLRGQNITMAEAANVNVLKSKNISDVDNSPTSHLRNK